MYRITITKKLISRTLVPGKGTRLKMFLTETERLQNELLDTIETIYKKWDTLDINEVKLHRDQHLAYLKKGFIEGFSSHYVSLDASRPWLLYWALHSFDLLDGLNGLFSQDDDDFELLTRTIKTIEQFQDSTNGGFCGGNHLEYSHIPHLAPTFASISAIAIMATPQFYDIINRPALKSFLLRLKTTEGSFRMHEVDGEIDTRAVYCAVVAGKLTGIWDDELEHGVIEWLASCQTWEGGFGGVPGSEAHGGYTYCALSAAILISPVKTRSLINIPLLLNWLASQQVEEIGGFRGRTNKLVDGCYSFWQAACFQLISQYLIIHPESSESKPMILFDSPALQRYILLACQNEVKGGLRDKPGKSEDFYHTCYCLSGLSIAQHQLPDPEFILGGPVNLLKPLDVRFNLLLGKAEEMQTYFHNKNT